MLKFLADQEKVEKVIYWIGFIVCGWVLKGLSYLAKKTKTTVDDEIVEKAKEAHQKAKK